jgi:hypothetical protein
MTNRAPIVKCNTALPGAPEARAGEAKRGETYRRVFVHFHAGDGQEAADVVIHVYRDDADGAPVIDVVAAPPGARVVTQSTAAAEAATVRAVREAAKASEMLPWRVPTPVLDAMIKPDDVRCPHDGAKCHHNCSRIGYMPGLPADLTGPTCYRKKYDMALTSPYSGFPQNGDRPIGGVPAPVPRVAASHDDFSAVWATELGAAPRCNHPVHGAVHTRPAVYTHCPEHGDALINGRCGNCDSPFDDADAPEVG